MGTKWIIHGKISKMTEYRYCYGLDLKFRKGQLLIGQRGMSGGKGVWGRKDGG